LSHRPLPTALTPWPRPSLLTSWTCYLTCLRASRAERRQYRWQPVETTSRHWTSSTRRFSSDRSQRIPNPPDHDRIRRTVSRVFTPPRIAGLEPRIEQIASELVQGYAAAGGGEFIEAVAGRLPVYVIGEMLGIPTDDWEQIREWSEAALRGLSAVLGDPDPSTLGGAVGLHAYLGEIADGRAAEPDESLASRLVEFEQAGEINREELVGFLALMFVAGHETTSALLAHTLERLAGDPDLLTTLQADPDLIGPFVEEMLRTYSPLQRVFRVATSDTQVEGVDIPAGSTVVVLIGAGNRDGARFPAGDDIDLTAPDTGHMAFGQGIHYCLGAPLARLEARIAIRQIIESVSEIRLDPNHPVVRFSGGSTSELNTTELWLQVESKRSDA
jgi:cytochrome P450